MYKINPQMFGKVEYFVTHKASHVIVILLLKPESYIRRKTLFILQNSVKRLLLMPESLRYRLRDYSPLMLSDKTWKD